MTTNHAVNKSFLAGSFLALTLSALAACSTADGANVDSHENIAATSESLLIGPAGHSLDYQKCADEAQNCVIGGAKYVAFGTGSSFVFKPATGTFLCGTGFFGADPAVGQPKSCHFANFSFRVNENGSASPNNTKWIAYGANGAFNFKKLTSTFSCTSATFGGDPAPGFPKACYEPLLEYGFSANEGQNFATTTHAPLAFGANGNYVYAYSLGNLTLPCNISTFANQPDPAPGVAKSCFQGLRPHLTEENGTYSGLTNGTVLYSSGLNGNFLSKTGQTSGACTTAAFGGDPHYANTKHCWGISVL